MNALHNTPHTLDYTRTELRDAILSDHALTQFANRFLMDDRDHSEFTESDLDNVYEQWHDKLDEGFYTPAQVDPTLVVDGKYNKYMVADGLMVALGKDNGATTIISIMIPYPKYR